MSRYDDDGISFGWILLMVLGLGGVVGGCVSCSTGCAPAYSDGDRAGVVTKFSNKGLTWKSWEGEMNLGGSASGENGTSVANIWRFHASDPAVVTAVHEALGSGTRVKMHYRQWFMGPISQDSDYDVTSVTTTKQETR